MRTTGGAGWWERPSLNSFGLSPPVTLPTLLHPSPANPAAGLYYLAELIEEYTVATSRIIKYMIWVSGSFSRSRPGLAHPASAAESGDCLVWNYCGTENPNSEGVLLIFLSPARYRLSLHYGVQITPGPPSSCGMFHSLTSIL